MGLMIVLAVDLVYNKKNILKIRGKEILSNFRHPKTKQGFMDVVNYFFCQSLKISYVVLVNVHGFL